jgi:hypothetical protein
MLLQRNDGRSPPGSLAIQFEIQDKRVLFEESMDGPEENPLPFAMNHFHFENAFFMASTQILIHNGCGFFGLKRVKIQGPVNRLFDEVCFIHGGVVFFQSATG